MLLSYLPGKAKTDDVVAKEDVLDSVERGLTEMYVALQSGKALKLTGLSDRWFTYKTKKLYLYRFEG